MGFDRIMARMQAFPLLNLDSFVILFFLGVVRLCAIMTCAWAWCDAEKAQHFLLLGSFFVRRDDEELGQLERR